LSPVWEAGEKGVLLATKRDKKQKNRWVPAYWVSVYNIQGCGFGQAGQADFQTKVKKNIINSPQRETTEKQKSKCKQQNDNAKSKMKMQGEQVAYRK
jgi:hypothetical protein